MEKAENISEMEKLKKYINAFNYLLSIILKQLLFHNKLPLL